MTLTNLLLRGVKSQFNADANRKTLELPVNVALPFTQLSSCISLPGKCENPAGGHRILQISLIGAGEMFHLKAPGWNLFIILTGNRHQPDIKLTLVMISLHTIFFFKNHMQIKI